ncbi:SPOR domain-containing protein [bacterium]|nr:MAG: SPOR domain-containing protein [bacterium]
MVTSLLALTLLASAARAGEPALLKDIKVEGRRVVLKLSRPSAFRSKAEADPPKLSITFSDTDIVGDEKDIALTRGMARWVSSSRAEEGGVPATRVTVHLDSARDYAPVWSGNDLVLEFKGPPPDDAEPAEEAPKAKPAAKAAAPKAAPKRSFRVQLGSFPEEAEAQKLKGEAAPQLGGVEVLKAEVGGKTFYRVSMGPYPTRAAAAAALKKAADAGRQGIVTKD